MNNYKQPMIIMRLIIISLFISVSAFAQNTNAPISREVKTEYGIITQIDSIDVELSGSNFSRIGFKYLFNIFHLQVVTALKDTLHLGFVYNVNTSLNSLLIFRNSIGKPFIITTSEFTPSNSDFPKMANCDYVTGVYSPAKNSFLFNKPYTSIQRVIEFVHMDPALWQELLKLYN
jgi:hypothetical protein